MMGRFPVVCDCDHIGCCKPCPFCAALRARIECMEKERNLMIEGAHESAIKRERLKEAARGFVKDCHYCGGTRTVAIRTSESRLVKGRVEPMPDMEREEPCEYCGPTRAALDALKEGKG